MLPSLLLGKQAASELVICAILFLFLAIAYTIEKRAVVAIDDDVHTTQDYAIEICNPPANVTDSKVTMSYSNNSMHKNSLMYEPQWEILIANNDETPQDP